MTTPTGAVIQRNWLPGARPRPWSAGRPLDCRRADQTVRLHRHSSHHTI